MKGTRPVTGAFGDGALQVGGGKGTTAMSNRSRRVRRSAWGSVTQVSPGVWRIRYWGKGPDGEYRRRSCTVRGSRVDAERRRSELMLEHSEEAPCPTVGQAYERWYLPIMERRVSDGDASSSTLLKYRRVWERLLSGRWGHVGLDAVRPLEVQQWLDGLTRTEAEDAMRVLRPLGDYAVRYGVSASNPYRERYVMPSRGTVRARDRGSWDLSGLCGLWHVAGGQWWEAAFLLAAFGGLRTGEALGVLACEVYRSQGCAMVPVERQVSPRGLTDRLKTPQSRRVAPVPGSAGERLLWLAGRSDGYLSGDGMGGPSSRRLLQIAWDSSGAGHPFQNLRAAWQTWMRWEMRVPPWAIEAAMGHLAPGVTGHHYDRPQADVVAEVVAEAYASRPYDAGPGWPRWDDLGPEAGKSAGQ